MVTDAPNRDLTRQYGSVGIVALAVLSATLAYSTVTALWPSWRSDPAMSHGPVVPLVAIGLLWARRRHLGPWTSADLGGLLLMCVSSILYVAAVWADVAFLRPMAVMAVILGAVWYFGGRKGLRECAAATVFLVFMIPWPTMLVDRISFPLQMTSSAYATMLGGIAGLPLHRDGVHIVVATTPGTEKLYEILVGKECSGLTSLTVLLALGYLCALFTPVRWWLRVALFLSVVPLAILANAIRLTAILLVGTHVSASVADWVHDNEGPVLIFGCTLALLGLRRLALACGQYLQDRKDNAGVPLSAASS
jgi:exosortase